MNTKIPFFIDLSKEFAMARFIPSLSLSAAPGTAQHISMHHAPAAAKDAEGSRTLAGMLLAAVMAALLVVADQVIDTWADGHLLAGWVALWTVAFAALALLAPPMRQVSSFMAVTYDRWAQASRLRRQEEVMWEYARKDPRVMAELQAAWRRERDEPLPYELDTLRASSTH
jgi:hypothetical protein